MDRYELVRLVQTSVWFNSKVGWQSGAEFCNLLVQYQHLVISAGKTDLLEMMNNMAHNIAKLVSKLKICRLCWLRQRQSLDGA